VLINLPGKEGNVDSSVTLSRDEEVVTKELREFIVPLVETNVSISR
jgi:hypothetical protein